MISSQPAFAVRLQFLLFHVSIANCCQGRLKIILKIRGPGVALAERSMIPWLEFLLEAQEVDWSVGRNSRCATARKNKDSYNRINNKFFMRNLLFNVWCALFYTLLVLQECRRRIKVRFGRRTKFIYPIVHLQSCLWQVGIPGVWTFVQKMETFHTKVRISEKTSLTNLPDLLLCYRYRER